MSNPTPLFGSPRTFGLSLGQPAAGASNSVSPVMQQMQALLSGLSGPLNTTIGNANSDLQGNLSPSLVRSANAMFGAGSGIAPGSEFLRNRGFDLYSRGSNALKQQGQQSILGLLSGISGAYNPLANIQSQESQLGQQLGSQERIAQMNNAQRASEAEMQNRLGMGNLAVNLLSVRDKLRPGSPLPGSSSGLSGMPSWTNSYLL